MLPDLWVVHKIQSSQDNTANDEAMTNGVDISISTEGSLILAGHDCTTLLPGNWMGIFDLLWSIKFHEVKILNTL